MRFPNRGGYDSGRSQSYDQRGSGRGRSFDRPAMHDAVCAKCGVDCQVPFVPNGRREVFCSKCFETMGGGNSRDSRGPRNFGHSEERYPRRSENRDQRDSRSFGDRPSFDGNNSASASQRPSNSVALAEINAKLDKLITLLSPAICPAKPKKVTKKTKGEATEEKKVEKKAKVAKKK